MNDSQSLPKKVRVNSHSRVITEQTSVVLWCPSIYEFICLWLRNRKNEHSNAHISRCVMVCTVVFLIITYKTLGFESTSGLQVGV